MWVNVCGFGEQCAREGASLYIINGFCLIMLLDDDDDD